MTANFEARALLDQLMGTDRDAPLPAGAALPSRNKRYNSNVDGGMILPSSKRSKSVYDRDIDPLYTAWGVDVYDLFVNTKSDIGPNPYTVDEGARKEYLNLPQEEKEKLGFEARLFAKLQELVSQGDRTIKRNKEKLNREIQRQSQKRGVQAQNYVVDVPDGAVEELVRTEVQVAHMKEDVEETIQKLIKVRSKEKEILDELKVKDKPKEDADKPEKSNTDEEGKHDDSAPPDDESKDPEKASKEEGIANQNSALLALLGKLTLEKQNLVCDVANIVSELGPLEDTIEVQLRNLNHVKSDITSDKTVCEVSGNFMSARDADERIAAHYAGKQYVGWKLVRDKLKEMIKKYGKYGPPRPQGGHGGPGGGGGGAPLMSHQQYQQQQMHGRDDRGGGYGGGGYDNRRGSRSDRDRRWERGGGGGGGGGSYDGPGRYDRRDDRGGGGGHSRGGGGRDSYGYR